MALATCRNSLNTKKENDKGRAPRSVQLFTAAKTRINNNWLGTRSVEKKSKAVADHELNVFEAGYGTIKKSWKTLSPVLLITRKASASIVVLFWVDL